MRLKRIDITGFKSFHEATALGFDTGITAVVGPNGCGKSNVVDAIRWVMGEQNARNLRGRAMEDVIFGGSESRRPLGMAEVSLLLDNSAGTAPAAFREYAEIQVTRRLFRNGESEYLLNRTPCRLLDITELFMDTGVGTRAYSIIEQGKIGQIINSRPEERRSIIEEAAGVTKYKARRKAALRKIEATRQNLLRLGDIIGEVRRQMGSLKRQAQRAERFRTLRDELRGIELQQALREHAGLSDRAAALEQELQALSDALTAAESGLAAAELAQQEARLEHARREQEANAAQERLYLLNGEVQKLEAGIELNSRELATLERERLRLGHEQEETAARLAGAAEERAALSAGETDREAELQRETAQLAEAEGALAVLAGEEAALNARLEEARRGLYQLLTGLSRLSAQQDEAGRRLKALTDQAGRNRQDAVAIRDQSEDNRSRALALQARLLGLQDDRQRLQAEQARFQQVLETLRGQLEETEQQLLVERETLSRQRSRLESLEQLERNLDGYGRGVRALLGDETQRGRLRGLLADALEVPAEFEAAVEAVLGERLQALLAASRADVAAAFNALRQGDGRCTLLPADFLPAELPGFAGGRPLADLVTLRGAEAAQASRLLAGIYLVDDLGSIAGGLPAGVTLVTREGDLLTYRGEYTGGGRRTLDQGLLHKKREMKELASAVRRLTTVVESLNARREELRREAAAAEEGLRSTAGALHQQEIRLLDLRRDQDGLEQEAARLQERLEVLSFEEDQLHEEEGALRLTLSQGADALEAGERERLAGESGVAALQAEAGRLREQLETVRQLVTSRKVVLAGLGERAENSRRQAQRLQQLAAELTARREKLLREQAANAERQVLLEAEAGSLRQSLGQLLDEHAGAESALRERRESFEETRQVIEQGEHACRELRQQAVRCRDELSARQLAGRELALAREHLRTSFIERGRLDLDDPAQTAGLLDPGFDAAAAAARRDILLNRVEELGEVNLTAIDEHRELEERLAFMVAQQEDLQRSLEGLQDAITRINRTTRKRFRETFDLVNQRFREVFPRLFKGGQAELRLTGEEDLLEAGIEIVAQPPGKKLQNVTLLSGGEKALTAVALIFAIFLIKPSPFCLLDEVDAPLDDANIGRFNEMVREMSSLSQFIIITHNKQTMEIADNLYGITMEEPGVSRLVSVRMSEVA